MEQLTEGWGAAPDWGQLPTTPGAPGAHPAGGGHQLALGDGLGAAGDGGGGGAAAAGRVLRPARRPDERSHGDGRDRRAARRRITLHSALPVRGKNARCLPKF